jgi:hypothetical protein
MNIRGFMGLLLSFLLGSLTSLTSGSEPKENPLPALTKKRDQT